MAKVLKFIRPFTYEDTLKLNALTQLRKVKERINRGQTIAIGIIEEAADGRVIINHQLIQPSGVSLLAAADILKNRIKDNLGV